MTPRKLPPTKVQVDLREPEAVGAVEQHVPVVPADELTIPKRLIELCDKAQAEGTADAGDGVFAYRLDPPKEAALINLPRSQMLYVSFNDVRPAERWLPVAHLQKAVLNGWDYLSAGRLYSEPSLRIFEALENLFGRGPEPRSVDTYAGGCLDFAAIKFQHAEKVEIESLIEIDPSAPGSASKIQIVKFRGTWLPLRKISKILARRQEREQLNYNPNIRLT